MLKLFRYLKPYWAMVTGVVILVFLQTLADLYLPTLSSDIINNGVMQGDIPYIYATGGFMLLIAGLGVVFSIVSSYWSSKAATGLGTDLRNKVFEKVESFSLHEFDKIGTATLITRTTNDITQVQQVTMMIMRMMISSPLMMIGALFLALQRDIPLTSVLFVAIPVLAFMIFLVARLIIPLFRQVQIKIDRINLVLREKLTGIRVIRAFNTSAYETERFQTANDDLTDNYIKINKIMAFMMPSVFLIMNLTSLAILWFGIIRINENSMDMGTLLAFTQYAMQIMFSIIMLSMMFIMVPRAQAAAVRINEVLNTEPGIVDREDVNSCFIGKGFVEFKDVTFSYFGAQEPALKHISFSAQPGEMTAIIGSTGAGKTTLVNLIPRFYEIDSGEILVDGVNVNDMTQECLREKIGFVSQKAILFSGTISHNIRVGKEDATDEEVEKAADIAQATEFINEMDEKFDHEIAQGGTNVSGGQKQRLSIARALVRRPEIYVFDDSFSALDFKTDSKLRAALKKEIAEATVIIVAQRVGTVMEADRIIVLDEGEIAGVGTHKELLVTCEVYREIVSSQLSEEEIS
ncbi:MAG: ABC transporter ATP-binding protein [Clostridia bacterium]